MRNAPNRIAALAVVLLVLACIGALWWVRGSAARPPANGATRGEAPAAAGRVGEQQVVAAGGDPAGRSQAATQCGQAMADVLRDHVLSLRDRNEANAQLAYGMALPFTTHARMQREGAPAPDPERLEHLIEEQGHASRQAFERARALAPGNRDVRWLAATHCGAATACMEMQQALLEAEPDNAAAWLMALGWAEMRKDPAAAERAFERAAQATGYDRHPGANHLAMLDAFAGIRMPAACMVPGVLAELRRDLAGVGDVQATDFVLAWSMATTQMPATAGIRSRCQIKADEPRDGERRAACGRILEKMAASDTLFERGIALSLLVQLTADGPDAAQWRERYRQFQWMQAQMTDPALQGPQGILVMRQLEMEDYIIEELPAIQAALEASGRWPPPADWLPRDEHARSLVVSGGPPPPAPPK